MDKIDNKSCYDVESQKLNLTHHDLRTVPTEVIASYADCTRQLDLSFNRLSDLNWIYEFVNSEELVLDNNRLNETHLRKLKEPLKNINILMLNKNEFSDLHITIEHLSRVFPSLEHLSLHGNAICPDGLGLRPFSEYTHYSYGYYRSFVISAFPNLKFLDHNSTECIESNVLSTKKTHTFFNSSPKLIKEKLNQFFKRSKHAKSIEQTTLGDEADNALSSIENEKL